MTPKLLDDCFLHDGQRMRHDEALALLKTRISAVVGTEQVPLAQSNGRTLAQVVTASQPVPAHTNSAVDGYAFCHEFYDRQAGTEFPVAARAAAGHALATAPPRDASIRIFTGAVLPAGFDTVAMQEDVSLGSATDGSATAAIPGGLKRGANVRKAGEDVQAGEVLLERGHRIRPQDIAAMASVGLGEVLCHKRLRAAIVSTGDEVVRPGSAPLKLGQVYDTNAPMLAALLANAGIDAIDLGVLPDDPLVIRRQLGEAATRFDVVLTSGGASRGEEDHLAATLDAIGKRHLWQLAIKPGRPMMFGQIGNCLVLGLPGNPVAVLVCFLMYVWPMLARLGGSHWPEPVRWRLPATFDFSGRKAGRREFWRGTLVRTGDGLAVDKFARDGSGLISGLRAADGLIDIPEDHGDVNRGDLVSFIPFSEFGILGRS